MQSGENLGFAGGVNFGLRRMLPLGFDGFVILNNDTVQPPDLLQKVLAGAEARALDRASPVIYRYPDQHMGSVCPEHTYRRWSINLFDRTIPLKKSYTGT